MLSPLADLTSPRSARTGRTSAPAPKAKWIEVQAPTRSLRRYRGVRALLGLIARLYSRVRVEGAEQLPAGPAILCFTHQNWADPFYVFAAIPRQPRLYFFGPKEEEMRRGVRNRLMRWTGVVVPYRPGNRGLLGATARVERLLADGAVVAVAGEGQIHSGESIVLPLRQGPAYLALRAGVPVVPVAINGTSWLGFRRVVRVRIGMPISVARKTSGRPTAGEVTQLTGRAQSALEILVGGFSDQPKTGRVGRWLTELFNEWPDGVRPATAVRSAGPQAPESTSHLQ